MPADPCIDAGFTALNDLRVNDGIQNNLSNATPPGGTYFGNGVVDNGDGTYDFDPLVAGVGGHVISYRSPIELNQYGQSYWLTRNLLDLDLPLR